MIFVEGLTKKYKSGKGVFDLDFDVKEGEVLGYLGPNGSGKTTTIRLLLGFLNGDEGSCTINGLDCRTQADEIQAFLGYMPGEISFLDDVTGIGFIQFMENMKGFRDEKRRNALIERFELDPHGYIRKMSKGMKQKVGLVTAFMHDPSVLILDEPTSGLDPLMQQRFIELIVEEKQRGKTILISSHIFEEIERTCDRAAIIKDGRLAAVEDIKTLKNLQRKKYKVSFSKQKDVDKVRKSGLSLGAINDKTVEIVAVDDYKKLFSVLAQCEVTGLEMDVQNLEQVFLKYYGQGEG